MRRREEEKAKARRADRGLPPRREQPSAEAPAALLSNGDGPHADTSAADASEDKEVRQLRSDRKIGAKALEALLARAWSKLVGRPYLSGAQSPARECHAQC